MMLSLIPQIFFLSKEWQLSVIPTRLELALVVGLG
jgi:hypothetical protein